MIRNFRHVGIVVSDLEAALDFYGRVLGLQVVRRLEEGGEFLETLLGLAGASATTVKMGLPGPGPGAAPAPFLELLYFHVPPAADVRRRLNDRGPTHLALTVDDLEAIYRRLREEGFDFISPPVMSPDGAVKLAFGSTPDGVYLELVEEISPRPAD